MTLIATVVAAHYNYCYYHIDGYEYGFSRAQAVCQVCRPRLPGGRLGLAPARAVLAGRRLFAMTWGSWLSATVLSELLLRVAAHGYAAYPPMRGGVHTSEENSCGQQ